MLLHLDGSRHRWFQDERWYDLLVALDDANSAIYYAQLVEEESVVFAVVGMWKSCVASGVSRLGAHAPLRIGKLGFNNMFAAECVGHAWQNAPWAGGNTNVDGVSIGTAPSHERARQQLRPTTSIACDW
jgi:hypothetical protein